MRKHALMTFVGVVLLTVTLIWAGPVAAIFYDFETDPPPNWGNEHGNWKADGGYFAQSPTNSPATYSSLPWLFTNVVIEVDVRDVSDGGIFVRSIWDPVDNKAINGVLLLIGGNGHTGRGLYWHKFENKVDTGLINKSGILFSQGDDIHVKLEVKGNIYRAYVNGQTTPATTFVYDKLAMGYVGLYDFTGDEYGHHQRFDNFQLTVAVVPIPGALFLVGTGLFGLVAFGRRR